MTPAGIVLRRSAPADLPAVAGIHRRAFGRDSEAALVGALLTDRSAEPVVSLIALRDGEPVGHILFTRCTAAGAQEPGLLHLLAPLAVVPELQKRGIGGALIARGVEELRKLGCRALFVLGSETYYPRHGFLPDAAERGFQPPYPLPEEHAACWMVRPLTAENPAPQGRIVCARTLDRPEYWSE